MRHHAEFYLAVVGREEEASLFGYERLAYLFAVLAPDGDVLQVGVARRQSSGGGDGLVERGVNMSGAGVDEVGQRIDVGAKQFFQSAVRQDVGYDLVFAFE